MYIFFSKIFLKRNHSTCLAFLLYGTSTFHKILSFWQPVYRRKVWQEGQPVCEYCVERKLLQRQMIRFITLKWTKSFCIFDLLRLYFHFGRVWSHFYSQLVADPRVARDYFLRWSHYYYYFVIWTNLMKSNVFHNHIYHKIIFYYCRDLLLRQMIHFITLKSTKSFCIFDLLRLCFHIDRKSVV